MDKEKLVSVIIPCYNSGRFVSETITSVLKQSLLPVEIIFVDDGSTDNSSEIVSQLNESIVTIIKKNNTGVSDSRNVGLGLAKGEFVLFLDADDILAEDFLEKRVQYFSDHPQHGFCFSSVIKIDEAGNRIPGNQIDGVGNDTLKEILSYNFNFVTCPSNYLFRRSILEQYFIRFNAELSSSADRFFLVELSRYSTGGKISEGGYLFYRVHKNSMSNYLSVNLLQDNNRFQQKILKLSYIPRKLKKTFRFKINYIFAGSYYKLRKWGPFTLFFLKAFYHNPVELLIKLVKSK